MRRLARHLFTLCSAVSLLLCVGVCALWVRSYWRMDQWSGARSTLACAESRGGRLTLYVVYRWPNPRPLRWHADARHPPGPSVGILSRTRWKRFGLYHEEGTAVTPLGEDGRAYWDPPQQWMPRVARKLSAPMAYWNFGLPYWMPGAALAGLPAWRGYRWWIRSHRARRAALAGLCSACGYDLRASSGRCPECGALKA